MTAHSKLGASSMYRWVACPGSVRQIGGRKSKTSTYAAEGTLAHDLAAEGLIVYFAGKDHIKAMYNWVAKKEKAKIVIPEDMLENVLVYVNYVIGLDEIEEEKPEVFVEQKLNLESIHPGLFGTGDLILYYPKKQLLRVMDYKHGAGIPVEVHSNLQLKYYGVGGLLTINKPCENVEITVAQPRCYHVDGPIRTHEMSSFDLLEFTADIKEAALKTEDPNAELNSGDHCRFCPAAVDCPALINKSNELAKLEFSRELGYKPKDLCDALDHIPVLKTWIKNVEAFAFEEAKLGVKIPGYKIVDKKGRRGWNGDEETITDFLMVNFDVPFSDLMDTKLKSVAQIEKLLSASDKKLLKEVIVTSISGQTLVPEADGRKEVNTSAQADFEIIKT